MAMQNSRAIMRQQVASSTLSVFACALFMIISASIISIVVIIVNIVALFQRAVLKI